LQSFSNASVVKELQKRNLEYPSRRGMHRSLVHGGNDSVTVRFLALLITVHAVLASPVLGASNLPVRYKEGVTHGFLVLSTMEGNPIAVGDLEEVAHGNRVTSHLVYHFNDGSLQDETTVFSQRQNFSLITYHLIQKGPTFPHPTEVSVVTATGQVTVRYTDDKGEEKIENEHLKLPPDLANGLVLTLLKNVRPGEAVPQLSMVVATPKPRIVKLSVSAEGRDPFTLAGSRREAVHYLIKVEIGGIAGLVAPLIGKQPPDAHIWIIGGEAPTFVKSETLSYLGGPVWRTELVSPVWPKSEKAEPKNGDTKKP
jgi:hypothetical protein